MHVLKATGGHGGFRLFVEQRRADDFKVGFRAALRQGRRRGPENRLRREGSRRRHSQKAEGVPTAEGGWRAPVGVPGTVSFIHKRWLHGISSALALMFRTGQKSVLRRLGLLTPSFKTAVSRERCRAPEIG